MGNPLLVEELVINDSFIRYCLEKSKEDLAYWENYLLFFPEQKNNLEEARQIVLGLAALFDQQQQEAAITHFRVIAEAKSRQRKKRTYSASPRPGLFPMHKMKKYFAYCGAAAAVAAIAVFSFLKFTGKNTAAGPVVQVRARATTNPVPEEYVTHYAEKRKILLPDHSSVLLNAGSTLQVAGDFGNKDRQVRLTGEAYFDVARNKSKPFIVHMQNFDVRVLGTVFNVKAYPDDKTSETSLIGGRIEVVVKNRLAPALILEPHQKVIIDNHTGIIPGSGIGVQQSKAKTPSPILPLVLPVTVSSSDRSIIETAWTSGRLEFYNKTFGEIKADLERTYNVSIYFDDDIVTGYRFSAYFEKENIGQVMKALQLSYPFHYTIDGNRIRIAK
jgi:ferric-dicitrate binding protein FerR (iron transport regulator)